MKVRLVFHCPYCGSEAFRPSSLRKVSDPVFRSFGLHPQRCHACHARFYSFDPEDFRTLFAILDGPRSAGMEERPAPVTRDVEREANEGRGLARRAHGGSG